MLGGRWQNGDRPRAVAVNVHNVVAGQDAVSALRPCKQVFPRHNLSLERVVRPPAISGSERATKAATDPGWQKWPGFPDDGVLAGPQVKAVRSSRASAGLGRWPACWLSRCRQRGQDDSRRRTRGRRRCPRGLTREWCELAETGSPCKRRRHGRWRAATADRHRGQRRPTRGPRAQTQPQSRRCQLYRSVIPNAFRRQSARGAAFLGGLPRLGWLSVPSGIISVVKCSTCSTTPFPPQVVHWKRSPPRILSVRAPGCSEMKNANTGQ